jgi:TonB family protein
MTPDDLRASSERPHDFASALIRHAARRAPDSLSQRLEEEWLSDLADRHGQGQRLRLALGCLWATRVIAADYLALERTRSAAAITQGSTLALGSQDPRLFSRRSIFLLMILSIHALAIYGLISGLPGRVVRRAPTHNIATVITTPEEDRVPITPPSIHAASLGIGKVTDIPFIPPVDFGDSTDPVIPDLPPVVTDGVDTGDNKLASVRRIGGPARGFPSTDDYYPDASRRSGEQGISTVQVCVDQTGRLTAAPSIAQSSGNPRLDEGALRLAHAGSGFYRSTTENGQPVADCYAFRVRFTLAR